MSNVKSVPAGDSTTILATAEANAPHSAVGRSSSILAAKLARYESPAPMPFLLCQRRKGEYPRAGFRARARLAVHAHPSPVPVVILLQPSGHSDPGTRSGPDATPPLDVQRLGADVVAAVRDRRPDQRGEGGEEDQ